MVRKKNSVYFVINLFFFFFKFQTLLFELGDKPEECRIRHWPPLGAEDGLPLLPVRASKSAPLFCLPSLSLQPPWSRSVMVTVGMTAPLVGGVAISAIDCASTCIRIQWADWATDVWSIRK